MKRTSPSLWLVRNPTRSAGFFEYGSGGRSEPDPHLLCDEGCEGGLPQSGRAVKQEVIECLSSLSSGLDRDVKRLLHLILAYEFRETMGPERGLHSAVLRERLRRSHLSLGGHFSASAFRTRSAISSPASSFSVRRTARSASWNDIPRDTRA